MSHGIIIALAALDAILGILLYVTIQQIQNINRSTHVIDKIACEAAAKADRNAHKIDDCCKAIQLISRDTDEAYKIAAECRNELTRMHMAARKGDTE